LDLKRLVRYNIKILIYKNLNHMRAIMNNIRNFYVFINKI